MKQVLISLDDETAARLERVAPTRAKKRSEFIRVALREALDRTLEAETAAAYRRQPDAGEEYFDPAEWDPGHVPAPPPRRVRGK